MHTSLQRLQNSASYFTTVVLFLAAAVSLTSLVQLYATGSLSVVSSISQIQPNVATKYIRKYGSADGKAKDVYGLKFDLESDLTSLFNWNTKQIFVYLTAEYDGQREDIVNRVTFWDRIITTKEDAVLNLHNARGSYKVYDTGKSIGDANATVRLEWNIQPHVGPLLYGETIADDRAAFVFPIAKN